MRRVGTIALVHETLSQGFDETVDFDEDRRAELTAVVEVATQRGAGAHRRRRAPSGGCGRRTPPRWRWSQRAGAERRRARPGGRRRDGAGRGRAARSTTDEPSCSTVVRHRRRRGAAGGLQPRPQRSGHPDRAASLVQDLRGHDRLGTRRSRAERVVRFVARLAADRGRAGGRAARRRGSRLVAGCGVSRPAGASVAALERATLVLGECRPRHRRPGRTRWPTSGRCR